ncbi:hypothetical protein [Ammoniphilus sp. CFH 90114]|uniref:hypothetical protein n=1 Tax=Ammoniphilus sp. CFH 90114 TaxID=2493665 RepID=UPI0013E93364|nr:hypothetical protein [Ammoniphilus sp. CFH 90114]
MENNQNTKVYNLLADEEVARENKEAEQVYKKVYDLTNEVPGKHQPDYIDQ